MTDEDIVQRVAGLFGTRAMRTRKRNERWRDCFVARLKGKRAIELMHRLRPYLGTRRREQVDRALASHRPDPRRVMFDEQAREALEMLQNGASVKQVAARFGVTVWSIYDLRSNRTFRHLSRP